MVREFGGVAVVCRSVADAAAGMWMRHGRLRHLKNVRLSFPPPIVAPLGTLVIEDGFMGLDYVCGLRRCGSGGITRLGGVAGWLARR